MSARTRVRARAQARLYTCLKGQKKADTFIPVGYLTTSTQTLTLTLNLNPNPNAILQNRYFLLSTNKVSQALYTFEYWLRTKLANSNLNPFQTLKRGNAKV